MKNRKALVIGLIVLCILITIIPLALIKDSEFGGADGMAEELITEIQPDYEPWFESIIAPPGGETESLLFCIQVGIGVSIIAYGFGYLVARKKYSKEA